MSGYYGAMADSALEDEIVRAQDRRVREHKQRIAAEMAEAGIRPTTIPRRKRTDLSGQRFGRLVVQRFASGARWVCLCDCGETCEKRGDHLRSAPDPSCGCRRRENMTRVGRLNRKAAA